MYVPTDDSTRSVRVVGRGGDVLRVAEQEGEKDLSAADGGPIEYACRAGTTTAYSYGDDPGKLGDFAWFFDNSEGHTHPVTGKKPNPWGLYDMHGNVFQWCTDFYDKGYYDKSPAKDPANLDKTDFRVLRGGCWHATAKLSRSASRNWNKPDFSTYDFGFRVAMAID